MKSLYPDKSIQDKNKKVRAPKHPDLFIFKLIRTEKLTGLSSNLQAYPGQGQAHHQHH
jgi:hypothetical protein